MTVHNLLDYYVEKSVYLNCNAFVFFVGSYELRLSKNIGVSTILSFGKYDLNFVNNYGNPFLCKKFLEDNL